MVGFLRASDAVSGAAVTPSYPSVPRTPPVVVSSTNPNFTDPLMGVGVVTSIDPLRFAFSTNNPLGVETPPET